MSLPRSEDGKAVKNDVERENGKVKDIRDAITMVVDDSAMAVVGSE